MCARRPTSAMPKPFLCCERAFCCSMVVMWPVLMHVMSFDVVVMSFDAMWLLVLCHVTWCNAMSCDVRSCDVPCNGHVVCSKWFCDNVVIQSTILYYKVLLCTTKYYSSTTLYYSVLQSTTPVLLCTAKYYSSTILCTTQYYSSTTKYYKVLLPYYSVLRSTTPVLLCTAKYYSSTTLYYTVLQRTTPVLPCTTKYYSSTTLYCNVLLQNYKVLLCTTLQRTTPVLPCTTKYYSSTTLYWKVLLQYYCVLQSTTPVLLCTTQYYNVLLQYYSVLQSTTPVLLCTAKCYSSTTLYYTVLLQYYSVLQCAEQQESSSNFTKYCTCHAKWLWWLIRVTYETSFTMRGATGVTIQLHQILRLPRKMNLMIDPRLTWNVIYNRRSNRNHNPTSPNTAPATQNESHDWSAWQMKRHLQCAEQQESSPNFTKYCACHAKWISWLIRITYETSFTLRGTSKVTLQPHQILCLPRKMNLMIDPRHIWNVIYNARSKHSQPPTSPNTAPATKSVSSRFQRKLRELLPPIERRFEDNPGIIRAWSEHEIVISHPPLRRPYSSDLGDDFVLKNTTFRAPAISQNVTKCCACHEKSHSNFTKCCACHAKCISWLIRVTYETSFTMRGASNVNLQPQQILRLPRKMNLMFDPRFIWNFISNAQSKQCQPPTSANTAPATKSLSSRLQRKLSELLPPI